MGGGGDDGESTCTVVYASGILFKSDLLDREVCRLKRKLDLWEQEEDDQRRAKIAKMEKERRDSSGSLQPFAAKGATQGASVKCGEAGLSSLASGQINSISDMCTRGVRTPKVMNPERQRTPSYLPIYQARCAWDIQDAYNTMLTAFNN